MHSHSYPEIDQADFTAELLRLKNRVDTICNNVLCDMKPGWDDSIEGFNKAWDLVRDIFQEEIGRAAQRALNAPAQAVMDWKAEALRRFGPIPAGAGENSRLIAAYHYAFIEGAKAALALPSTEQASTTSSVAQAAPNRDQLIALIRSKARVAGHDAWEGGYYHLANAEEIADAILALSSHHQNTGE